MKLLVSLSFTLAVLIEANIFKFVLSEHIFNGQMPIFQGTRWCGAGNVSKHPNDFGSEIETDVCCRNHDFCSDYIEAFDSHHGLTNNAFYTRVSCDCDYEFYDCLKKANTKISNRVGNLYFNILEARCFRKDYPVVSCLNTTKSGKKCKEYEYDTSKEKVYQWFYVKKY